MCEVPAPQVAFTMNMVSAQVHEELERLRAELREHMDRQRADDIALASGTKDEQTKSEAAAVDAAVAVVGWTCVFS